MVEVMQDYEKYPRLRKLLEAEMDGHKILIFCETKRGCDEVSGGGAVGKGRGARATRHAQRSFGGVFCGGHLMAEPDAICVPAFPEIV